MKLSDESLGFWRPRASKSWTGNAKLFLGVPTKVLLDESRSEAVKARSHRSVRGEKVARSRDGQRDFKRLPGLIHESPGSFQNGERRMPFIQVADFRLDAERMKQSPSADSQHQFLLESQFRPAPIKLAGNASVSRKVRQVVGVQEVKLHSANLDLPGAQPDRVTGQRDFQPQPFSVRLTQRRDRQLSGIVVREKGLLRSVLVNHLAKIALLIEQPHGNHRHPQIAGGFELIAGHIAKPARVDGQSLAQHEFHAEIRDTSQGRLRVGLLKPRGRLRRLTSGLHKSIYLLAKCRVGQHVLELVPRDRLENNPGVLGEFPKSRIKLPPHVVGVMIPGPTHVQGKLGQGTESLDFRGQKTVHRVADSVFVGSWSFVKKSSDFRVPRLWPNGDDDARRR